MIRGLTAMRRRYPVLLALLFMGTVSFSPFAMAQDATPPAPTPPVTEAPPSPPMPPSGGRRVARDTNRPIGVYDTVDYEDPANPGAPSRCTVQAVFPGAYKLECPSLSPRQQIIRDIDVRRPGGQAPQTSAVGPAVAPFRPNDLVLVSSMGLMAEEYWKLCAVLRNSVASTNSYVVDCGYGPVNVLPDWVRQDPDFQ
jgi:hypothetical protein